MTLFRANSFGTTAMVLLSLVTLCIAQDSNTKQTVQLAAELAAEGNHSAAAVEFRRCALFVDKDELRAAYEWAAAHEYFLARQAQLSEKLLDRCEDHGPQLETEAYLLRGETALLQRQLPNARFYFKGILARDTEPGTRQFAALRLAHVELLDGDSNAAVSTLRTAPNEVPQALSSVMAYKGQRDKKPWLGGLLGIIPGLGYAYSGEYANGLRSLLLNSLFLYGMVETADDEQWAAFSVITFFELTWYTGSIYGGMDAAHRHNKDRMNRCLDQIDGNATMRPNYGALPIVQVRFTF